ncbi:inter-alpha-trypsin inhibitor heavy chain H3-like, partial [Clarias magur]
QRLDSFQSVPIPLSLAQSGTQGSAFLSRGSSGHVAMAGLRGMAVDGDPHFIIELPDRNDALCFNTDDKPGTIFTLVKDPVSGLVVNGQTIGDKKVMPGSKQHTYFGQFGIVHEKFGIRVMVTTQKITVSQHGKEEQLHWSQTSNVKSLHMDLQLTKDHSLTVTLKDSLKFIIILHKVWKMHPYHQDYLGFYTLDSHHLSERVHGVLGQFFHGVTFEVSDVFQGKDPDKPDAHMFVKGHNLTVTRQKFLKYTANLPRLPKNVVFVIDKSGSMWGNKMQQTRDAMQTILSDLHEEDHFALGFYNEVANVLLSDVHFTYPDSTVNSVTISKFKQLYNGSEIVVSGRMNDIEMNDFPVEVSAQSLDTEFVLKGQASTTDWNIIFPDQEYIFGDFTERLWAYLTIQNLLDKKDKGSPEEKQNATAEALALSLKYNFVTPLTSMVVTKPETEEKPEDTLIADKLTEDERPEVKASSGSSYSYASSPSSSGIGSSHFYNYHSSVNWVDSDPHFIIEFPNQNDALCFNINDKPGTIFNLVKDPLTGIIVNGQTIGDKKIDPNNMMSTYFGRFGIIHAKLGIRLMVTTQDILVSERGKQAKFYWSDNTSVKGPKGWQRDFRRDVKKGKNGPCWFIHHNGTGLIDGVLGDYTVSGLFTTV